MSKLFVSNLPEDFSESNISLIFQSFGEIQSIRTCKNLDMKKTTAFIEYMEDSSAQQAIDSLKDRCLHGMDKPLVVQYAIDRKKKVFVGNLPLDVSESSVSEFFSSYGKLLGVSLIEGKSN